MYNIESIINSYYIVFSGSEKTSEETVSDRSGRFVQLKEELTYRIARRLLKRQNNDTGRRRVKKNRLITKMTAI